MISFYVPGTPKPAGSKRAIVNRFSGKAYVIDACEKSRDWKTTVAQVANDYYSGDIISVPIVLQIDFYFPRPKGHRKPCGQLRENAPSAKTTKPDLTKIIRAVEDALTGIIWRDDSQVVEIVARKKYTDDGERNGARISIVPQGLSK